jgi:hypothetical protein
MALNRVRGCADSVQQADASRRQNGPRKSSSLDRARCGLDVSPASILFADQKET